MATSNNKVTVRLKAVRGRLAFANGIFAPQENTNDDGKKTKTWSAKLVIPKGGEQSKRIAAAMKEAAKAKWNDKAPQVYKALVKRDMLALHDGELKEGEWDGFSSEIEYLSMNSPTRPRVTDRQKNDITAEDGIIFSGCDVSCVVDIWPADRKDGKRINCRMVAVQFVSTNDTYGAGGAPADDDDLEDLDEIDGSSVNDDDEWGDSDDSFGDDDDEDDIPF